MNKFTEVMHILNKEKPPNVSTKWLITEYTFHCCLKEEKILRKISVFKRMEKRTSLKHTVYWFLPLKIDFIC